MFIMSGSYQISELIIIAYYLSHILDAMKYIRIYITPHKIRILFEVDTENCILHIVLEASDMYT